MARGGIRRNISSGFGQAHAPVLPLAVPDGVVQVDGEWYFDDRTPGHGVATLGFDADDGTHAVAALAPPVAPVPPAEERNRILDWFR